MAREPIRIRLPVDEDAIVALSIGDEVRISGTIVTARDMAHKYMVEEWPRDLEPFLRGAFIYHCGPIVILENGEWRVVSAGPTTSSREEPYQADVIEHYGVRGVIGKGGMGDRTSRGLVDNKAVYLHATGGAGTLLARTIRKVLGVKKLAEYGVPEALWLLEVNDFPAVVTMDSHGESLHRRVFEESERRLQAILKG